MKNRNKAGHFYKSVFFGFLCFIFWNCANQSQEKAAFNQSFESGRAYFKDECAKCHQDSGEGLGTLYPPLLHSDYLQKHGDELACIIYNGMKGPITVSGKQYNWAMPGHVNMDDYELAALITYVQNRWGYQKGITTIDQARAMIILCRTKGKQ